MSFLIIGTNSSTLRRLPPAASLAAALLVGFALGSAPTATAAWDKAGFDACWDPVSEQYMEGDITDVQYYDATETCCQTHGGNFDPFDHVCRAPAIVAASTPVAPPSEAANPDVPAGSPPPPPTKPGPKPLTPRMSPTLAPSAPVG